MIIHKKVKNVVLKLISHWIIIRTLANRKLTEKTFNYIMHLKRSKIINKFLVSILSFPFKNIYKPNFKKIMKINRIPIYKSQFNR